MLISKRRLQCGLVAGLCVLAAVLLRPMRSWIDAEFAERFIAPELSVSALTLHTNTSVIEARDVHFSRTELGRQFGFSADRMWLAIDGESLIDRQLGAPHARLENVRLYLRDQELRPIKQVTNWQQEIAARLVKLDWAETKEHLSSLVAADDVHETWAGRINRWVDRSREILSVAQGVDIGETEETNPLRAAELLQQQIAQVAELQQEQLLLTGQFDGIQKLLNAERKRIEATFEQELIGLRAFVPAGADNDFDRHAIAEAIVLEAASLAWEQIRDYGEVSLRTADAFTPSTRRPAYDQTWSSHPNELARLADTTATGVFEHGFSQTPFSLTSNVRIVEQQLRRAAALGQWHYRFNTDGLVVSSKVNRSESQSTLLNLRLMMQDDVDAAAERAPKLETSNRLQANASLEPTISPSDRLRVGDGQENGTSIGQTCVADSPAIVELVVAQSQRGDRSLFGEMRLDISEANASSPALQRVLQHATQIGGNAHLMCCIHVQGTWDAPMFTLAQMNMDGTADELHRQLANHLDERRTALESQWRAALATRLAKLAGLVSIAASEGSTLMDSHRRQLLAVEGNLQHSLDAITGVSFAKRPGSEVKNR